MKRRICVVTGSRAEYGLLRGVMQRIGESSKLELQLVVTGMHLSNEFGLTYKKIEEDGFEIDRKVEILTSSDTTVGITKSMGLGLIGFADVYSCMNPDLVLILGDRFEIFAAAVAALVSRVPIAHIHGGEVTLGAVDEAFRHSITKMSHLHFVATKIYRARVIQLGECPSSVYVVGGLGVDNIKKMPLLRREVIEQQLDFRFQEKNILVTFHPVTLEKDTAKMQTFELLSALQSLSATGIIFTLPNSDANGRVIIQMIGDFVRKNRLAKAYKSLGQLLYLSTMAQVDMVVGNSSSGIIEMPSFQKPTINIGDRQTGRVFASSVIHCTPDKHSILKALDEGYSENFQSHLSQVKNPYGEGGASESIVNLLEKVSISKILKKSFYDLKGPLSHPL